MNVFKSELIGHYSSWLQCMQPISAMLATMPMTLYLAIVAECIGEYAIHYRILNVSVSWAVPLVSLSADSNSNYNVHYIYYLYDEYERFDEFSYD